MGRASEKIQSGQKVGGYMVRKEIKKTLSAETEKKLKSGRIPPQKVDRYFRLLDLIIQQIMPLEVIVNNAYTRWFKEGQFDDEELKYFLVQFSVFSNLFIEAQLKKTINAPTLEAMHASKEILMNELGVVFRKTSAGKAETLADVDPELVGTEGTIESSTFRFAAAHFEWLLRMAPFVGLQFQDLGKRKHGSPATLFFCDELSRLYGSEDPHTGLGASFAVENWAAAGFWKELIQGLEVYKKRKAPAIPIAFFTWHDKVEDQHAKHTWDELEEEYFCMELDEAKFLQGGKEMLAGVLAFWNGLNEHRLKSR